MSFGRLEVSINPIQRSQLVRNATSSANTMSRTIFNILCSDSPIVRLLRLYLFKGFGENLSGTAWLASPEQRCAHTFLQYRRPFCGIHIILSRMIEPVISRLLLPHDRAGPVICSSNSVSKVPCAPSQLTRIVWFVGCKHVIREFEIFHCFFGFPYACQ